MTEFDDQWYTLFALLMVDMEMDEVFIGHRAVDRLTTHFGGELPVLLCLQSSDGVRIQLLNQAVLKEG